MAAYTPTAWVNNVAPALSATNLNKLTDELELQASEVSLIHTLPTWTNGVAPALTDAAPLNEMERVLASVAVSVGLSYTATVWEAGWYPGRNAYNFNRMEQQAAANRTALDAQTAPLVFAEAALSNPIEPTLSQLSVSTFNMVSGADYLIDLQMVPRNNTLILVGSPRRVHVKNAWFQITTSSAASPYSRGGLGTQLTNCEHLSVTDYFVQGDHAGCTLTDGFRIATDTGCKVTLQRARIEARQNTSEPAEHCDALQVQGPVGEIQLANITAWAAGVQAPNDGGKCFQIAHEPWPGTTYGAPFSAHFRRVNMRGQGIGGARFGTMFIRGPQAHHNTGVFVGNITETLEDVWAVADGTGATDFSGWMYVWTTTLSSNPNGTVTGSAPNRVMTYNGATQLIKNSTGGNGVIREGIPPGGDYCTRSMLGVS